MLLLQTLPFYGYSAVHWAWRGEGGLTNAPVERCGWGTDPGPVLDPIFFPTLFKTIFRFSDPEHLTQNHTLFILGATDISRACSHAYVLGILILLLSTQPSAGNRSARHVLKPGTPVQS